MPHISLPADISLLNVTDLHQQLSQALGQSDPLILQADAIRTIDTAGLQLLTALAGSLNSLQQKPEWQSPSDELIHQAETLGLLDALNLSKS